MALKDLDELVLLCRNPRARDYIREAVASYTSASYRSAIVSTWIAVVFDILAKLRDLDLTGDKNAAQRLHEFESIRAGGEAKLTEALRFEREILQIAEKEFEFLTPLERADLERLRDDRNRCAHPSMQSTDEPYVPPAELARLHIRNAVDLLLSREPVQGPAAFKAICAEILSPYFPKEAEKAYNHFASGPVRRARHTLVKNLIVGLSKGYLLDDTHDREARRRIISALAAIFRMHRQSAEPHFRADITKLIMGLDDKKLARALGYIRAIPDAWELVEESVRSRLTHFMENALGVQSAFAVFLGLQIEPLKPIALTKLAEMPLPDLVKLVTEEPLREFIPRATSELRDAKSWRDAEYLAESLILPLAGQMDAASVSAVLDAVTQNSQAWDAARMPDILLAFREATKRHSKETATAWASLIAFLRQQTNKDNLETRYARLFAQIAPK